MSFEGKSCTWDGDSEEEPTKRNGVRKFQSQKSEMTQLCMVKISGHIQCLGCLQLHHLTFCNAFFFVSAFKRNRQISASWLSSSKSSRVSTLDGSMHCSLPMFRVFRKKWSPLALDVPCFKPNRTLCLISAHR